VRHGIAVGIAAMLVAFLGNVQAGSGHADRSRERLIRRSFLINHPPDPEERTDVLRLYLKGDYAWKRATIPDPGVRKADTDRWLRKARWLMERAVQRQPESRYANFGLANVLLEQYRQDGSRETLALASEFLRAAADRALAHGNVLYTAELSSVLSELGDEQALRSYFERFLSLDPSNWLAHFDYANGLRRFGASDAESHYEQALVLSDAHLEVRGRYAEFLAEQGKEQDALRVLDPAFEFLEARKSRHFQLLQAYLEKRLGNDRGVQEALDAARNAEGDVRLPEAFLNELGLPPEGSRETPGP
jgi:predicted Zn-dependent protease